MPPPNKPGPAGKHAGSKTLPAPKVGGITKGTAPANSVGKQKTSEERAKKRQLPVLRQGSLGHDVQKLQQLLNIRIAPSPELDLDGEFGPLTFTAVVQYQQGVKIAADGVVGKVTWLHLLQGDKAIVLKSAVVTQQPSTSSPAAPVKMAVPPVKKRAIWEWTIEERLVEVLKRIPERLPAAMREKFRAAMQMEGIAVSLVILAGFCLLSGGTALILGAAIMGINACLSLGYALYVIATAYTDDDLNEAADELAVAVIDATLALFLKGVKYLRGKVQANAANAAPPPKSTSSNGSNSGQKLLPPGPPPPKLLPPGPAVKPGSQKANKILYAEPSAKYPKEIIGGHSPRVQGNDDFRFLNPTKNPDGTTSGKLIKKLPNGKWSKTKNKHTLFPNKWGDQKILDATNEVAETKLALGPRARDGATLHRKTVDGVQIEVIKDANGTVTSSYPTGGKPTTKFE